MMNLFSILYILETEVSTYNIYHLYHFIKSLRRYEEKLEKTAKWTNTAEH